MKKTKGNSKGKSFSQTNNRGSMKRGQSSKKNDSRNFEKKDFEKRGFERKSFEKRGFEKKPFFDDNLKLEGRNSVLEALNNDRPIDKIFIKSGEIEGSIKIIIAKAREKGILIQEASKLKLDEMSESSHHQGIIAVCPAHKYAEVDDILQRAYEKGKDPFIIILDEIADPYNLGAIIRTAEASGVDGVIIPKRRAVGLTGIVSKTSAGALEHVLVARETNLNRVIEDLKKKGIWVVCADMKGTSMTNAELKGPIAVVIGGEGEGVSRLTKQNCDFSIKIPMYGKIESLNASVAAGVVMYEVVRQRNER